MITKVLVVSKSKGSNPKRPIPRIRIAGKWLKDLGFEFGKFVSVEYKEGFINLSLETAPIDNSKIWSKNGFLRVGKTDKKDKSGFFPSLVLRGYWLNDMGFSLGDIVAIKADIGNIKIYLIQQDLIPVVDK